MDLYYLLNKSLFKQQINIDLSLTVFFYKKNLLYNIHIHGKKKCL